MAQRPRLGRQGGHPGRASQDRHQEDIADVEAGQHQAGDQRAGIHVADRPAQLVGQHDQHQAGRDDLRQRARGRDHPLAMAPVIAIAQHDRQRDQAHGDDRGRDDAGGGRQQRADDDHRIGQAAADRAEQLAHGVQQVLGHAGAFQHDPHEGEEGNGQQGLVRQHPQKPLRHGASSGQSSVIVPFDRAPARRRWRRTPARCAASVKATG
jgi:hypothetical protein